MYKILFHIMNVYINNPTKGDIEVIFFYASVGFLIAVFY
jgi:hypothetical protein